MQITKALRPTATPKAAPLTLPFLNTTPLWDVVAALYLIPVWWVIGLEQFIWPLLLTWSLVKTLSSTRGHIRLQLSVRLLALFIGVYLISGGFIVESFRIFSFVRNFSLYYSALCLYIVVTHWCRTEKEVVQVITALLTAFGISSILGLLAVLDVFRPEFNTLMGHLLPDSIRATSLGRHIAKHSLGGTAWFAYFGQYFRLTGFALFSTYNAAIFATCIPLGVFMFNNTRHLVYKAFWLLLIGCMAINFIFTTGRVAVIATVVGSLYYVANYVVIKRRFFPFFLTIAYAALLVILITVPLHDAGDNIGSLAEEVIYARGSGSVNSRMAVYIATLQGWVERPLFGWGTERDITSARIPAGSHSYYLAVLYKQGTIGFIVFIAMLIAIWHETNPRRALAHAAPPTQTRLLRYGRWILVTVALNSTTTAMDVDALTFITLWTTLAVLVVAGTRPLLPNDNDFHTR